ncbi:MAG: phosphoribosylformylglycinamidine synthase subunit PurL, partial [Chloroflexi bacterium]|nr:phosphoribosylformylglycinamidine synthase subunit PurL [Chloroflexota bacterium]
FYGTPFISGKDSLNNEYLGADGQRHAIPPTLLISAIGIIQNINTAVTMDLKAAGNVVYLVGSKQLSVNSDQSVPNVREETPQVYRALHRAIQHGLIKSAHDLSEGGLAVSAAEMCIGGRLGLEINTTSNLFNEVNGCLLVEISPTDAPTFEQQFANLPFAKIGTVTAKLILKFNDAEISIEELVNAFNTHF